MDNPQDFAIDLMRWYDENKRALPWRKNQNPYHVWLSEIILQQTRVDQGLPYYLKFVETFPKLSDLAQASDDAVMKLWQGLGYYSRARNMLVAARTVQEKYGGEFPKEHNQILQLKGVGEYTAAAISSISFSLPYAVVDGNVQRVLSRLYNDSTPVNSSAGKKLFASLANGLLSHKNPGKFNQAMMELGALVCSPQKPKCENCPVLRFCKAKQENTMGELPVKLQKNPVSKRYFTYLVPLFQDETLLRQRTEKDIYKGLYEFPLFEGQPDLTAVASFAEKFGRVKKIDTTSKTYRHLLSHRDILCQFFLVEMHNLESTVYEQVAWSDFEKYPISRMIDRWWKENKTKLLRD
jgi:A/G-specific adenine glycosylase